MAFLSVSSGVVVIILTLATIFVTSPSAIAMSQVVPPSSIYKKSSQNEHNTAFESNTYACKSLLYACLHTIAMKHDSRCCCQCCDRKPFQPNHLN
ncbi:unnamed protein product [Albugo candida]|uniref:Uncharacterized protein n=1 Tax=Albugo candida TaxID=65357 RepID=A0A024G4N2_9STRA|nr:unnamed protein product [Albugo candida]|eukprot:CCI41497.1 unnamed protein product [Albugo candida]